MGEIESLDRACRRRLRARHVIGRSSDCALGLIEPAVSFLHASVCWREHQWVVRDLGSQNGTEVDGQRLAAGVDQPLKQGARLSFAGVVWCIVDDSAPPAMAVSRSAGRQQQPDERWATGELLVLPDDARPLVSVYPGRDGEWVVENEDGLRALDPDEDIVVDGHRWQLCLPTLALTSSSLSGACQLDNVGLRLSPSADERDVRIELLHRGGTINLGVRAHHYMLLVLARARLRDVQRARAGENEHGWVELKDLRETIGADETNLRVQIFRARKQLERHGIGAASGLIERRTRGGSLRLGVARLEVVP